MENNHHCIALFGEAEKGEFCHGCRCSSLVQLLDTFGSPPGNSRGIYFAIQALLYQYTLFFFRVQEEGFSYQDYLMIVRQLHGTADLPHITAFCMPGLGDEVVLKELRPLCVQLSSLLIVDEADFYDYITHR